jgi:hypothetical protein
MAPACRRAAFESQKSRASASSLGSCRASTRVGRTSKRAFEELLLRNDVMVKGALARAACPNDAVKGRLLVAGLGELLCLARSKRSQRSGAITPT